MNWLHRIALLFIREAQIRNIDIDLLNTTNKIYNENNKNIELKWQKFN